MQEVKLHKAESARKPTHKDTKEVKDEDETKTEELYKKARGILNKLTPQNFQTLVKQMSKLEITSEDHLQGVANLVFEKAIAEPGSSVARMCRNLSQIKVQSTKKSGEFVNFRAILLTKSQKEFENDKAAEDDIEALRLKLKYAEESKKAEIEAEIVVTKTNARRRSLGNIRFIGELFKLKMLTEPIMHECVYKLLNDKDEESLECLCELLQTIGKELDSEKAKRRVDQYFQRMQKVIKEKKTSSRVKFMLQDVIELRMSNWVPRRDESNPKTMEQIHKEAQQETQEKQLLVQSLNTQAKSGGGGGRGGGGPRLGRDAGSMGATPDGWSTVAGPPSRRGERQTIDPARLRLSKNKWHMATSVSPPCDVCAGQSISEQAVEWCPECEEAYCSECIKHHGIAKATKHHQVIAVENYLKLPPFVLETKHHCKKHGSSFQNYCRSHETPCCKRCIDTDHKKCFDLPALDDVIQDAKSSVAFADIEERLHSLKKFFSDVITEKEENLNDLNVQRQTIEKQIRKMRIEINQRLDSLEKQIMHKLSNQEDYHKNSIEKISKQLKVQSSRIESLLENMEPIKRYASNLQTFLSTKEIYRELYKTEKEVEVLCEDGSLNKYGNSFIKDDKLRNFMADFQSFGEILSTCQQTEIVYAKSKVKQAQIISVPCKSFENMNLVLKKKVVVPRPVTTKDGVVMGCVILQNNHFLFSFCDRYNGRLSLLDEHGSKLFVLNSGQIGISPGDIAVINGTTVAISRAYPSKSIAIFNTETRKVSKVIETKQLCSGGISCFKNNLIYSCGKEGLEMRSLDTGNVCPLKFGSHFSNEYVTVFKNKIYSTDRSSDTVTCYDMEGKVCWRWQNLDEVKKMRGVAVDNNSNVYVAGVNSGRVAIISPDGKEFKSFQPEGIKMPRTLFYDKRTNKLLICEQNGDAGIYSVC